MVQLGAGPRRTRGPGEKGGQKRKGGMASHSPSSKPDDGVGLGLRLHGDEGASAGGAMEGDLALDRREDGVILAHADIAAGMKLGAALAQDDIAGDHVLTAVALHAEPPAGAIAPVAGTTACF